MRPYLVLRYIGTVLIFNAAFLALSAVISAFRNEPALLPLLYSSLVAFLLGVFPLIFVPPSEDIRNDEGLVIVVSSWLLSCLAGVMPYVLYGGEFTFTNAWFESVSGFTTTGSSVLGDVEAVPLGLLFWRASTHWIGGMGIIVFMLAVLPAFNRAAMILSRTEMSGLAKSNFQHRTGGMLRILLTVYVGLTVLETLSLVLCGMNPFDAVAHSFATIATGGFSTKNLSIAHYDSFAIEGVIGVFMILSGAHFGLLYMAVKGNMRILRQSAVARYYIGALAAGVILVAASIHGGIYKDWGSAFRHAFFQVLSVGTSTGFASADSSMWPPFAVLLMIFFTLQCACSGSTSGGIKTDRIVILLKSIKARMIRLKHPRAVVSLRFEDAALDDDVLTTSLLFICVYLGIVFLSTLLLTAFGVDMLSAFSGSAAAMGNVGPGFGTVGSMANYGHLPAAAKWVLTVVMLLGRLEIFGLLLYFSFRSLR